MSFAESRAFGGEIDRESPDISVTSQGLQKCVGDDQMAVSGGMNAVGTCDMVARSKLRLGPIHRLAKNP